MILCFRPSGRRIKTDRTQGFIQSAESFWFAGGQAGRHPASQQQLRLGQRALGPKCCAEERAEPQSVVLQLPSRREAESYKDNSRLQATLWLGPEEAPEEH